MRKKIRRDSCLILLLLTSLGPAATWGHEGSNAFEDHWLAAACTQVPVGRRLIGQVSDREFGTAVTSPAGRTLVLYCNVEPDTFHNLIQVIAEDNSPTVEVTATIFQQNIIIPGPPVPIASVTTTDLPGLQIAQLFFDPPLEPNELSFMYFIKIEVVRQNNDQVWVYSVSLRDVL